MGSGACIARIVRIVSCAALLAVALAATPAAAAQPIDNYAMAQVWARLDRPVAEGRVSRAWVWGPEPISPLLLEPYAGARAGSAAGRRWVQYFDKGRLEVADGANGEPGPVTSGRLAAELITGRIQLGASETQDVGPAEIPIVGDKADPGAPTYATFSPLLRYEPIPTGWTVIQVVDRAGRVTSDPALAEYGVTAAVLVPETNHTVASVFWDYLHSSGPVWAGWEFRDERLFPDPFAVTGYPISEAYWAWVQVDGQQRPVLLQAFERRVLTYTPANPAGWQVESANVGRHYYTWRYLDDRGEPALRIGSVAYRPDATGKWVFIGTVRNLSRGAYGDVAVTVNLYDENGEVIASQTGPVDLAPLGPGETRPFRVWLDSGDPFARAEVLATGQPGERRAHPTLVVERESATGFDGDRFSVRAEVRNAGETRVRYTAYVVALYDRHDRIVGYTWGLADPPSLEPGARATITTSIYKPPPTAVRYRLFVTGQ